MNRDDSTVTGAATLGGLRRLVAARLRAASAPSASGGTADLDAKLLVAAAAGVESGVLPLRDGAPADAGTAERALGFAARRIAGEPVARILGHKEFWGLDLVLSPDTLVPRPDTETVVEAALAFAARRGGDGRLSILDLGTGSGAILLALLSELPRATGVGIDLAPGAVAAAAANAGWAGLSGRAAFLVGDWGAAIGGRFDLIVANPPYIPTATIGGLAPEVRLHDPLRALDGGGDGLTAIRAILGDLGRLLAPGGAAFVEIGAGQGDSLAELAAGSALTLSLVRDLAGIDRVAILTS